MTLEEKIDCARQYVRRWIDEHPDAVNDAANLWADNFNEYMAIWAALQ